MEHLPRDNGEVLLWQYTQVSSTSSQSTLPIEDIEHVLTQCVGTSDTRRAKLPALLSLAATAKSTINIEKISSNNSILTQFLLDCTSCNLDNDTRISAQGRKKWFCSSQQKFQGSYLPRSTAILTNFLPENWLLSSQQGVKLANFVLTNWLCP